MHLCTYFIPHYITSAADTTFYGSKSRTSRSEVCFMDTLRAQELNKACIMPYTFSTSPIHPAAEHGYRLSRGGTPVFHFRLPPILEGFLSLQRREAGTITQCFLTACRSRNCSYFYRPSACNKGLYPLNSLYRISLRFLQSLVRCNKSILLLGR
jgi:hypothetical protein